MAEWDQAFKHNHKQSRYKLHNPREFPCSIMLQTNSAAFVVPILTQWLIIEIYNIHHTSQKLCYVLRAENATLLTFNMSGHSFLWILHLWSFHHRQKLLSQVTDEIHKLLLSMNLGFAHRNPFLPQMHRHCDLSGSSPSVLHYGSVAAAQALRATLTQPRGNSHTKRRPKMQLSVSQLMCCHTTANHKRVSLSFRHQDTQSRQSKPGHQGCDEILCMYILLFIISTLQLFLIGGNVWGRNT